MVQAQTAPRPGKDPFTREQSANFDECALVFHALGADRTPGIMIDVGAHTGSSLEPFARADWTVFAFEPDPANRAKLDAAISADPEKYAKVTVSDKAVSDTVADGVPFYASNESTGISGLSAFRDSHEEIAQISTTTLDHVRAEHGIDRIDFLKIDVEGHEMSVLKGLDFAAVRPRAVVAEFEDGKTQGNGYSSGDLASVFADLGYSLWVSEWHPIDRYGIRHSWKWIQKWPCDIPGDAWGNFVAFAEPVADDVFARAVERAFQPAQPKPGVLARLRNSVRKRLGPSR
ncbi:MAG: FkbM family methyltransferase [Pseudomonadota bacterium]